MSWNARVTPILSKRCIAAAALTGMIAAALSMAGCGYGNSANLGAGLGTDATQGIIEGHTRTGSNLPVAFMTVSLYAAGSTGYGSAGTLLATTTTADDGAGSFTFFKHASGNYPSSGADWTCPDPATYGDPQMYIVANGGNSMNTHLSDAADMNTAVSFISAIGPCSTVTAGETIEMNEVTTAATVFSLAQYMNPGTTPGTESIGTNGANLAVNGALPQGVVGLNNAVASIANLADVINGTAVTSNSYIGMAASVTGVTVTATPETGKLIEIANILDACDASQTAAAANCVALFSAATPPPVASVTSQPSSSFGTAQDVIQAAYYMAVNPSNLGTQTTMTCGIFQANTNTACLADLALGGPYTEVPSGFSLQQTDWTVGVTYTSTGTCGGGGAFISAVWDEAVDVNGDIWATADVNSVPGNVIEISPIGQPLNCIAGPTASGADLRGITIDTAGNVWAATETTGSAVLEYTAAGSSVLWSPTREGFGIAADGLGNVFITSQGGSNGYVLEFAGAATASTPSPATYIGGTTLPTGGGGERYIKADSAGRVYVTDVGANNVFQFYPGGSSPVGGYTLANIAASTAQPSWGIAIDAANSVYIGATCCGASISTPNNLIVKYTPVNGSATYSFGPQFLGGFNGVLALATDGAGNVWVGSEYPAVGTVDHLVAYALAEDYTVGTGSSVSWFNLSPAASNAANLTLGKGGTCNSASDTDGGCPQGGGFQHATLGPSHDLQIDISGNVWAPNYGTSGTGASMVEIVGAAVPTAAPLSIAAKNGMLATKP